MESKKTLERKIEAKGKLPLEWKSPRVGQMDSCQRGPQYDSKRARNKR